MRAVMAAFAIDAAVAFGLAVQSLVLMKCCSGVAGVAARLIQPGAGVILDLVHATMAVGAAHIEIRGHDIPQALCGGAGMAVVTAIRGIGHLSFVFGVHGIREIGDTSNARCADRVGSMTFCA